VLATASGSGGRGIKAIGQGELLTGQIGVWAGSQATNAVGHAVKELFKPYFASDTGKNDSPTEDRDSSIDEKNQFLTPEEFNNLPNGSRLDPGKIRYSQDSINNRFKPPYENQTLDDFANLIREGSITTNPIRIVERDGKIFTLDNRRLYGYQQAGLEINYNKLDHVPKRQEFKFTTRNDGESIIVRNKE
jgi:hypothetical protein